MLTDTRRAKVFIRDLSAEFRDRLEARPVPGVRLLQPARILPDDEDGWVTELATLPGRPRLTVGLWVDRWTEGPYRASLSVDGSFGARAHVAALARRLRPLYGKPIHRTDADMVPTANGRTQWKVGRGFTEPMLAGSQCSYAHADGGGAGYGFYAPQSPPWAGRLHETFVTKGLTLVEDVARVLRPKATKKVDAEGQGYLADPRLRAALEEHAARKAEAHYRAKGFRVTRAGKPYDLHCRRGEEVRYVEVKGTTTAGAEIFLTPNEVLFARKHALAMELFVVGRIKVMPGGPMRVRGGRVVFKGPWRLAGQEDLLKPTGYSLSLRPNGVR